ncbi:MAG: enoyl-CoA hydratase-related protein [Ilumatobacteraceae bacterium]|nr:enoyl-CoA hydratase-related protein [Ilumatobacteraceae bacterium]MDP4712604.1 enoyl-CoA hydratase-related protein [Ilumatobacteraceae bacterium]MDP4937298.1 enoyl-CoA hydratase-related protein [Ilumatobacteraceae bacterium]
MSPAQSLTPAIVLERPLPGVTVVRLNRPERLNAMTTELVEGLHQILNQIAIDAECRVVILTGAGRGFCAGLDLTGYGNAPHTDDMGAVQRSFAVQKHIASLMSHMRSIPQPIISAVNGAAAGGGLALVLGSDIRIGAESSKFNVAFIRVGFSACDIGTSWLLPRIVGVARAQEMMLTGRVIDSAEAYRIGLIVDRVADDDLEKVALAKAEQIMLNTPFGVALTKEAMWTALEIPAMQSAIDLENRQQIMASRTDDAREAMMAFMEKRPPNYQNK